MSPEVSESHFTQNIGMATGSDRLSPEVAVCHRKWPYDTGSGCMSPEVAVCHWKFAEVVYRIVNRMLTGLVGLKKNATVCIQ